jgi:hypothetical protein
MTIENTLRDALTEEQFKKAEKYFQDEKDEIDTCASSALLEAFVWEDTDEGHGYWGDIYEQLK